MSLDYGSYAKKQPEALYTEIALVARDVARTSCVALWRQPNIAVAKHCRSHDTDEDRNMKVFTNGTQAHQMQREQQQLQCRSDKLIKQHIETCYIRSIGDTLPTDLGLYMSPPTAPPIPE